MTRKDMILALTRYELAWVIDNPEHKNRAAEFFAQGGFSNLTDEGLKKCIDDNEWVEVEA
jgi:hypothetical protein